jgi:hypothetical protein
MVLSNDVIARTKQIRASLTPSTPDLFIIAIRQFQMYLMVMWVARTDFEQLTITDIFLVDHVH